MALTISASSSGDQLSVGGAPNYCYLYEPFGVLITESNTAATKLYIDVVKYATNALTTVVETKVKYVEYDFSTVKSLTIDLMEIAQQIHNANLYKIGELADIIDPANDTVLSKYMYAFKIYTDVTSTPSIIKKIPIIGVREYTNYVPVQLSSINLPKLSEFSELGINPADLIERWTNFKGLKSSVGLVDGSTTDATATTELLVPTGNLCKAKGGMIFWKSRKGGWMFWGMDLSKKTYATQHEGTLAGGMFRTTSAGITYVPVNYTEVKSTYNIELKALALSQLELISVAGIASTPVVYYQAKDFNSPIELMKLSSSSAPYTNLSNGGDFSVSLSSISITAQKTY
jgi:hypothetical protein